MKGEGYRFLVVSILFAGSLCMGCAQAPDEVKKDMEKYGENAQAEETRTKTCTIEELRNCNVKDITQEYESIVLPEHIDFSGIQEVSLLKFRFVKEHSKQRDKYAQAFGLSGELDWKQNEVVLQGETGMTYDSPAKREYLSVADNGFFYFEQKDGYTELQEESEEDEDIETGEGNVSDIQERIYLKRGDPADQRVNLNGQKVALSEEINWMNREINRIMSVDGTFQYDIRTVYIRKRENGCQRLSALAQMEYKGVLLAFFGGATEFDSEKLAGYVKKMDNAIDIGMDTHGEIDSMGNNGLFEIVEEKPLETVVDFQSAVDAVERKMAGFHEVQIEEVQAMYTLLPQYDYTETGANYAAPGNMVETRPVYSFMVKHGEDNSLNAVGEGNELCYINVDMVTGEVTDNFEDQGYTIQ